MKNNERKPENPDSKRPPLWLRILLMAIVVAVAAVAFYVNNLRIIDALSNR